MAVIGQVSWDQCPDFCDAVNFCNCRLASAPVMSVKDATTPERVVSSDRNRGCELIEIQVSSPVGLCTPMITLEQGSPVRKVTAAGNVSPGKTVPSS